MEEPLEAGEDGVFDLGDPSPPPSPVRAKTKAKVKVSPEVEVKLDMAEGRQNVPDAAIQDDWQEVDVNQAESPPTSAFGDALDGSLEHFADATGTLRAQVNAEASGETEPTQVSRAPSAKHPPVAPTQASFIATGLSSVGLPIGYERLRSTEASEAQEDSDGEGEFHDACGTAAELATDATKAKEMKETGNEYYKNGDFEDAIDYYTMAMQYCPKDEEHRKDRAVFLANRAQSHLRLEEYDEVVQDCTAALELNPGYVKAILRRAQANEHLEKYDIALEDARALVEVEPTLRSAKESVTRLEKLQEEKSEKMKEEALGKLKELGNSVLGNFGLSLDNFKMQQDPNTGSYSVNFER